jgi:cellulose synthase/poly-beta-1,6-N-acetylglucosamine synthase-like glycosyltransferase
MDQFLPYVFFGCLTLVLYTYVGYPLLLLIASRLWRKPVVRSREFSCSVSVVLAVRNEENNIGRRLNELVELVRSSGIRGEIVVVSDGSSDKTSAIADSINREMVRVIDLPVNEGKAAALTYGCRATRNEIIVFADARQTWRPDALRLMLENFADPDVGAVTGDLVIETAPGVQAGVGLYWKLEKSIRRLESRFSSMVGVTGAIASVRRELFRPIPAGTVLDDVYWPMRVAIQGYRVVHDKRAKAFDRLPPRMKDEFRRKVRTLTGNFQLVGRLPSLLLPWRNPIWWQFVSHKVCRLAVPWALLGTLLASAALTGPGYSVAFWFQVACYVLGLVGMTRLGTRLKPAAAAGSFIVLNAAAWIAFWKWSLRRGVVAWEKVAYQPIRSISQ